MGSKSKAPSYQAASYDSNLWGSSTTDKNGTVYSPEKWERKTMKTIGRNLNPTLKSMVNNDFMTDANFLRYQNRFNDQMNDLYDTSVLSNLAGRGLMRSSGLQSATDAFTDNLRRGQLDLYDNYYNRLNNNLSNMLNTSNTLYNYMNGINAGSMNNANAINNYNLKKWQAEQQAAAQQQALYGQIAQAAGSIAGGVAGGPIGSVAAGALAQKLGQSMPSA
jgi:hypothetical protein